MKIFETHAHYDDEAFREDREALFDEMFAFIPHYNFT